MRDVGRSGWSGVLKRIVIGPLALLGCVWLAGCYQFVEVDPAAAPVGARVRAELTSQGSGRLAQVMSGEEPRRIDGRVVEVLPNGGVLIEVVSESRATPVGISSRPLFSRVSVPAGDLMRLELKQLNGGRTAALVGGAAATAAVIVTAAFDIGGGGESDDDSPPVDQILIPLFSFRIGR